MLDADLKREKNLAYGRGYYKGLTKSWPAHKPPHPPHEIVRALMIAAQELRDEADGYLATLMPDDELNETIGKRIDELDEAFRKVTTWLGEAERLDRKVNIKADGGVRVTRGGEA